MYIGDSLRDVFERLFAPDELSPDEMEQLVMSEPQNIQIEMEPDSRGNYVPVGITYLVDIEI